MQLSTPWGPAHSVHKHIEGFFSVTTASSGGMMVSADAAEKYLSGAARKRALVENGHYHYMEDAHSFIPVLECKPFWPEFLKPCGYFANMEPEQLEAYLIRELSRGNSDYLLEMGIEPDAELYELAQLRDKYGEAIQARSPDVVAANDGETRTLIPGVVKVWTADGAVHYVTKRSFDKMSADCKLAIYRPISALERVNIAEHPPLEDRVAPFFLAMVDAYIQQCTFEQTNGGAEKSCNTPQRRLGWLIQPVYSGFVKELMADRAVSWTEASQVFAQKLQELHNVIPVQFKNIKEFEYYGKITVA